MALARVSIMLVTVDAHRASSLITYCSDRGAWKRRVLNLVEGVELGARRDASTRSSSKTRL